MLQAGPPPDAAPELLQRLQSHGAMPALSYFRHALRETSSLLLRAFASTSTADVSIACGPRQSSTVAASAARSIVIAIVAGSGLGTIVARIGRITSGRILPLAIDAGAVDALLSFLCYMLLHFLTAFTPLPVFSVRS